MSSLLYGMVNSQYGYSWIRGLDPGLARLMLILLFPVLAFGYSWAVGYRDFSLSENFLSELFLERRGCLVVCFVLLFD